MKLVECCFSNAQPPLTLLWPWLKGQHTNMCINYILCKHSYAWPSLPGATNSLPNTSVFICTLFSRCLFQSRFCRHCRGDCWRLISICWWRWTRKSSLRHFSVFIPFHKFIQQHWPWTETIAWMLVKPIYPKLECANLWECYCIYRYKDMFKCLCLYLQAPSSS